VLQENEKFLQNIGRKTEMYEHFKEVMYAGGYKKILEKYDVTMWF
jgi:hypothetical protein